MEKNFNTDNFEQLLREATDDFRMYPSKRVWHGIYNDLHPAKKWPSFAVLLLLVTSIMYIGVTNPNKGGQSVAVATAESGQPTAKDYATIERTTSSGNSQEVTVNPNRIGATNNMNGLKGKNSSQKTPNNLYVSSIQKTGDAGQPLEKNFKGKMSVVVSNSFATSNQPDGNNLAKDKTASEALMNIDQNNHVAATQEQDPAALASSPLTNASGIIAKIPEPLSENEFIAKPVANTSIAKNKATNTSMLAGKDESGWMEDYAFRNLKSRDNWKGRMSYQVYVTPSVGYRTLKKNADYSLPPANALVANPYAQTTTDYNLNHSTAINLEIGTGIIYNASKFLRLKAGVQINYTNYSINAQELNHPTFTTLMLTNTFTNTPILSTRTTTLANTQGPSSRYLNNSTYQVSLPIGADIKIAGNDQLKVYMGGTVQPTYIFGGQAYLISSDMKNYVAEENFIRKHNLNGSVEAFITYKTKSGVILSAGPQFRYQFFSTYNNLYTYDEKLYNLGVKLGMTKNF